MASDESLYPIAVLIEELRNEDVQMRLNSIKRLSTIALALGEERTRKELIPFLADSLDDEDEVLLAVAEELSKFTPLVGGPSHAHVLLQPLEALAQVEETVVRDKAVDALNMIAKQITAEHMELEFSSLVRNLSAGDWFASRSSACGLFAVACAGVSPKTQAELRGIFAKLCEDDTPMVRRAAASNLGKLAEVTRPEHIKSDLLPLFSRLVGDDQDSVRLLAVDSCLIFSKLFTPEECMTLIVGPLHAASKDRSWRVRYVVAEKYAPLQAALGPDVSKSELVPMLVRLLQDPEAEVRTQAGLRLPDIGVNMTSADRQVVLTTNILPHVTQLCADTSQHVRAAVASVLVSLCPVLGKEGTVQHLIPLFVRLLKDEQSEVRLNVVQKLDVLQATIGMEQVATHIIPEIVALAEDPQWRVRLAVVEQMPLLGKNLGPEQFDSKLAPLCLHWLQDNVYAIRESTVIQLQKLVEVFGLPWAKKAILPRVVAMAQDKAYLARLTSLFVISGLASKLDTDTATKDVLPSILKLAEDSVPNVRFNAARTLAVLIPKVDKGIAGLQVKPVLQKMTTDPDADVQFYSKHALTSNF